MSGPIRNRYEKCKIESDKLQEKMDSSQRELDEYKNRMESLKQKIGFSGYKQEALNLFEQLHNAELKRDELLEETRNVLTPAEEREKLLKQIKDNNQEISSIEKQLSEIKDVIESIKAELEEKPTQQEDTTSSEEQKEIAQKYKELRKREAQMDEFLGNFEENKQAEIDQLYNTRKSVVNYLELISKAVEKMNRESGVGNKRGARDSEVTIADLKKVEELEKKVTNEYEKLVEKKKKMDQELVMFGDREGLKRRSEARKQQLLVEKQNLTRYRENIKYELQTLQTQFEAIQAQLLDQETHNQVRKKIIFFFLFKINFFLVD